MLPNLIFDQTLTKKPPKKEGETFTCSSFLTARFQDGSRMGPRPPKSSKNNKQHTDFLLNVQAFLHFWQQILSQICCTEFNMFCIAHLIVPPSCWPSHAVEQKSWTSSTSQSELLFHVSRISWKHMIWLLLLAGVFAVPGSKPFRLEKIYILRL